MSDHPRVLEFERQFTRDAARTMSAVPPDRLIILAERRAGYSPVRDIEGREFGRELREELADARNYALWWIEQMGLCHAASPLYADVVGAVTRSLAATAVAFHEADQAQTFAVDLPRAA